MTRRTFFRKILSTPEFFMTLSKHLDEIFPDGWIYDIEEQGDIICAVDSTAGWQEALKYTCIELNIYDVYKYWASLDWVESDMLDETISELLCATVYNNNNERLS